MPTNVYILLDRSGSMQGRWRDALGTINGYVAGLAETGHDGVVTCVMFDHTGNGFSTGGAFQAGLRLAVEGQRDHGFQFDALRTMVRPKDWRALSAADATPRGGTPLYDAIGRLCAMADADANPRGLILIMTDGEENASRELSKEAVTALLDKQRNRGWEVINLGVDYREVATQAMSMGAAVNKFASVGGQSMRDGTAAEYLAQNTRSYAVTGAALNITEADKAKLEK